MIVQRPATEIQASAHRRDDAEDGTGHDRNWFDRLMENEIIRQLPNHLRQYVVDQNHGAYTAADHAVWRYVLRQSCSFLKDHAHRIYLDGLARTGLRIDAIPSIEEMNQILSRIGWAAVPVNGFIPPSAFMEFQAHRTLVIAADMRQLNHIEYTPSPDIIHEAAGHAPIIADPQYAEYLRLFGQVGSKAMSSKKDYELYEAIRRLSILKESPGADPQEIEAANRDLLDKQRNLGEPSEMALLTRLHWWTVEYGLIGEMANPRLYGAALLSSIGESASCLSDEVKKIPYSLDALNYPFDITTKQPQLFVTPNFPYLNEVLTEFADTMSFSRGGCAGLNTAVDCGNTATAVYSSGLEVSGTFAEVLCDEWRRPILLRTTGPTALAVEGREISGCGKSRFPAGFVSPIGMMRHSTTPLESLSDGELASLGIATNADLRLDYDSGIAVTGRLERINRVGDNVVSLTVDRCRIGFNDNPLVELSDQPLEIAVGERIVSVYAGAADKDAFEQPSRVSNRRTIKVCYTEQQQRLHDLYQQIRQQREGEMNEEVLTGIAREVERDHPDDWLALMEILELLERHDSNAGLAFHIRQKLSARAATEQQYEKLIADGLRLIDTNELAGIDEQNKKERTT